MYGKEQNDGGKGFQICGKLFLTKVKKTLKGEYQRVSEVLVIHNQLFTRLYTIFQILVENSQSGGKTDFEEC